MYKYSPANSSWQEALTSRGSRYSPGTGKTLASARIWQAAREPGSTTSRGERAGSRRHSPRSRRRPPTATTTCHPLPEPRHRRSPLPARVGVRETERQAEFLRPNNVGLGFDHPPRGAEPLRKPLPSSIDLEFRSDTLAANVFCFCPQTGHVASTASPTPAPALSRSPCCNMRAVICVL